MIYGRKLVEHGFVVNTCRGRFVFFRMGLALVSCKVKTLRCYDVHIYRCSTCVLHSIDTFVEFAFNSRVGTLHVNYHYLIQCQERSRSDAHFCFT